MKTKEEINKRQKEWRHKNKEHFNQWQRDYYKKNSDKHNKQNKETYYRHHKEYRLKYRKYMIKKREEQKKIVFEHYSKGKNCCELCGITDIEVLTMDHIDGNGTKHRKDIMKGDHIENWLIKNKFPVGFRLLCMNCQFKEKKRKKQVNPVNKINFDSP